MNSTAGMKQTNRAISLITFFAGIFLLCSSAVSGQTLRPRLVAERVSAAQPLRTGKKNDLSFEVRYRLVTMNDYTVFDWIEAKAAPNGEVTLRGQVTNELFREKVEQLVNEIGSVTKINNYIEVLPLSEGDKNLRKMLYRAVYNQNTALSRYAVTTPTIHIIVKNGSVDLRGAVETLSDSEMAFVAANAVPRVSRVTNNLRVNDSNLVASVNVSKAK